MCMPHADTPTSTPRLTRAPQRMIHGARCTPNRAFEYARPRREPAGEMRCTNEIERDTASAPAVVQVGAVCRYTLSDRRDVGAGCSAPHSRHKTGGAHDESVEGEMMQRDRATKLPLVPVIVPVTGTNPMARRKTLQNKGFRQGLGSKRRGWASVILGIFQADY